MDTLRAVRRMLKKAHPLELESMCIGFLYIFMPLIAQFRRQAKGLDGTLTKREILRQKVESYLKENLKNKELTATDIASFFSISSRQLTNIYSPSGTTVMARLKELRLSEAARKLREHRYQKRSVREISELCGFGSFENFCRSFKSHFGVSATEWKAKKTS
ncbi:AraC family transcriptional regulator [uncultured Turicimonas sp.]|uniref:AraC family transcriptional regulator n=1 Tax=uncultured Turicimonas sp. TaxID=1918607 RepID=UPI002805E345|nr:AraC family transcriptional regulator [uncultured Turicimonas sp.]